VGTVIDYEQRSKMDRHQRWDRIRRAELLEQYRDLHAQGLSQRQAAKRLDVPRTTLQAWHAWQDRLDACPHVGAFFGSVPGLACLHRLVLALHVVFVEIGACGLRLVCLFLEMTGLNRFVGASFGTQQRINLAVEEAIVADTREETQGLAQRMTPKVITVTQDETFTGGLCLVAMAPVSNYILLEPPAEARDHDTWNECMKDALAPLKCQVLQSTSDEAPGLLAYVASHLGAHHSPDLFHVQQELSKAVSAPLAIKQRAAEKAATKAEETLKRGQAHSQDANAHPERRGPGRPPKAGPSVEPATQEVETARQACQRLTQAREQVSHNIRAIGHTYHFVDLERGVRRNGKLIAHDLYAQIDTIRTLAQQERLSETCMDRIEKAERVVPKMQATIDFVSTYVRQQVRQLDLTPPESYAMHAHLLPSSYLVRVAATKTMREGQPLRELAHRIRTPLFEPGGVFSALSPAQQDRLQQEATKLAEVFQRSSANVEGRNGYLSFRNHALRGLDHPRKRVCLTAVHNFLLTRPAGTTAAERFFGQKPRSMFAAILASVEIPPAPLSPPRRAVG
jgi:Family of unknown function (DUF6399)